MSHEDAGADSGNSYLGKACLQFGSALALLMLFFLCCVCLQSCFFTLQMGTQQLVTLLHSESNDTAAAACKP